MTGRTSRHWQSCYLGRWAMIDLSHIAEGLRGLAVEVGSLHADPANARKGHAVERIAASLRQYGQRKPIVVNRLQGNKVEAGNGTLSAARLLGWSHVAAVFVEDDAATATGFGIADNRTGDLSEWDFEALDLLLGSIDPDEIFTGFEAGELDKMGLPDDGQWGGAFGKLPDEDRAPFQQMTFTLHDEQVEQVKAALMAAKALGPFVDSPNENSNGNALARIAELFVTEHGQG